MDRERNLLFGLIAAKWHGVDLGRLDVVVKEWQWDPESSLPKRAVDVGVLSERDGRLIWALVKQAEHYFKGDRHAALEAFGGEAEALRSLTLTAPPVSRDEAGSKEPSLMQTVEESPNRYAMQRVLGRGGMGRVLLMHDAYLGRDVALKELMVDGEGSTWPESSPKSTQHLVRFLREARVTGRLEHPSIVPVYELGRRADGQLYYTMRLVPGRTLKEVFEAAGTWQERLRLLPHFVDLCQAIAYAHSRGVLHRDLKPANVMIGEFGETVVLDWGLAKETAEKDASDRSMVTRLRSMGLDVVGADEDAAKTAVGAVVGTPAYMAPEQARGDIGAIDERSDVYALGVVLYELLTGQAPFPGRSVAQVLHGVLHEEPESVLSIEPHIPQELVAICERAMQKQPEARYAHVRDLADDIERFESGRLVQTYAYGLRDHLRRFVMRNKAAVASAIVALAAVVIMALVAYGRVVVQRNRAEAERNRAEAERNRAEQEFYFASVVAAQNSFATFRPGQARKLLAACPDHLRNWEWGYVQYLCNQELLRGKIHNQAIFDAGFSPDGRYVATAGEDCSLRVREVATADEIHILRGHKWTVRTARFFSDGRRILSASFDGTAREWDVQSGQQILLIEAGQQRLWYVAPSPDGERIATAGEDGTVRLWNAGTGEALLTIPAHQGNAFHVVFSPDGSRLATSGGDQVARLWDAATGAGLRTLEGHLAAVKSVEFSPDGRFLATVGDEDCTARIWDAETGGCLRMLALEANYMERAAFRPDGERLATSGGAGRADLWNVATGLHLRSFAHEGNIMALTFNPSGTILVTGSTVGTLKAWDVTESASSGAFVAYPANSWNVAFHPDGKTLAYSRHRGGIEVRDFSTGRSVATIGDLPMDWLFFSPDGGSLLSSGGTSAYMWEYPSGRIRWHADVEGGDTILGALAFGVDGSFVAVGKGPNVAILDANSGGEITVLRAEQVRVHDIACSPDGLYLACVGFGKEPVQLYKSGTWEKMAAFTGHDGEVISVAFSPDSRLLATGGMDTTVRLWDLSTKEQVRCLEGHIRKAERLAFSPDGSRLASAGNYDHTIRIWDVQSGRESLVISAHTSAVRSVAFSPDGRLLSSADESVGAVWPTLPWQNSAYPGSDDMPLEERIELFKLERYRERAGR